VEPDSRQLLHEVRKATMTHAERKEMREKHNNNGKQYCSFCYQRLNYGRERALVDTPYPCDVIKVLDYLDIVDPMPTEINWQGGK